MPLSNKGCKALKTARVDGEEVFAQIQSRYSTSDRFKKLLVVSQLLSSFAISVAANMATALFARNNTEKEIRKAFQEAIEMWCPNEDIRRLREPFVETVLRNKSVMKWLSH